MTRDVAGQTFVGTSPFPATLVVVPTSRWPTTLPEATVQTVMGNPGSVSLARYDVVWFPRPERDGGVPSPLMGHFARRGHRVFWVNPGACLPADSSEPYRIEVRRPNLLEVQLAGEFSSNAYGETVAPPELLPALMALRRTYGIDAAISHLEHPYWGAVAANLRDRCGWRIVYDCRDQGEDRTRRRRPLPEYDRVLTPHADLLVRTGPASEEGDGSGPRSLLVAQTHSDTEIRRRIDRAVQLTFQPASIVIVTFDGHPFTRLCLESVLANTEYPNYEVIVVDNGSTDGTVAYLHELVRQHKHVRVVFNDRNLGFAAANNQGLAAAIGEVLVLLNNDTLVPHGWLTRLIRHLKNPGVGLVGPVTNRTGNEAQIEVPYRTYGELAQFAQEYAQAHEGEVFDIRMLTMFCVAVRRDVYQRIGPLDERFEIGLFEDDDYSMRVRAAGYRVVCAEDVYVHHFGQATIGKLAATGEYGKIFEANRRRWEEKWRTPWEPYRRRINPEYEKLIGRVREVVRGSLPPDATVIVVSKGDSELLQLGGCRAWHFPETEEGIYAGYYPAESGEAIAHLEVLRAKGAGFLLFPRTAFWWLEHYGDFRRYLESRYRTVVRRDDTCLVFALDEAGNAPAACQDAADARPATSAQVLAATRCSIIVPVYNKAWLTRRCLDALLSARSHDVPAEVIVVDDGSTDATRRLLPEYGEGVRIVARATNGGFAQACNSGAAVAAGEYLVFLNNDTIPKPGWLDALVRYADAHPQAAVVGSKLLFPNETIQHAGVVICQDRYPRHLYVGLPGDHPAVNKSRRFQIVTAACMLVRRAAFEKAAGFDTAFRNGGEDVDLCLRLGEHGYQVHYCHESVLYHLESISHGGFSNVENTRLYERCWRHRVQPDDIYYYLEDGLLSLGYAEGSPITLRISPLLAVVSEGERERLSERLLSVRSRQVRDLLKETVRLTVDAMAARSLEVASGWEPGLSNAGSSRGPEGDQPDGPRRSGRASSSDELPGHDDSQGMLADAHEELVHRDQEIQFAIYELQAGLAALLEKTGANQPPFTPSSYLGYQQLIGRLRALVRGMLPADARLIVLSKGDEELVRLGPQQAWHFPQAEDGGYAGFYPPDSAWAIAHLESLRAKGGDFLVIPRTAFWWLEHYGAFRRHLEGRYRVVLSDPDTCWIVALR